MHSKCYNFVMLYTSSLERWFASGKRCHLSSITVFKLHDGSILRHVYLTANSLFLYYDLETLHSFIYLINTFWANLLLIRRHSRSWGYEDCQDKCCFPKNMAWKSLEKLLSCWNPRWDMPTLAWMWSCHGEGDIWAGLWSMESTRQRRKGTVFKAKGRASEERHW